jgi:hypothetical protein
MKESLLATFEDLITNFSARRLLALFVLVFLAYGIFVFYERHTGSFGLGRLQRATDLLEQLHGLQKDGIAADPAMKQIHETIVRELAASFDDSQKPVVAHAPGATYFWLKVGAAAVPWLLMGFYAIRDTRRKKESIGNMALGLSAIMGVACLIAGMVPTVGWPWFNLLVWPFLQILIPVLLLAVGFAAKARKTKREQREANNASQPTK